MFVVRSARFTAPISSKRSQEMLGTRRTASENARSLGAKSSEFE